VFEKRGRISTGDGDRGKGAVKKIPRIGTRGYIWGTGTQRWGLTD
jgi:hypothetical protein